MARPMAFQGASPVRLAARRGMFLELGEDLFDRV
jgi:hypothetical protein